MPIVPLPGTARVPTLSPSAMAFFLGSGDRQKKKRFCLNLEGNYISLLLSSLPHHHCFPMQIYRNCVFGMVKYHAARHQQHLFPQMKPTDGYDQKYPPVVNQIIEGQFCGGTSHKISCWGRKVLLSKKQSITPLFKCFRKVFI